MTNYVIADIVSTRLDTIYDGSNYVFMTPSLHSGVNIPQPDSQLDYTF